MNQSKRMGAPVLPSVAGAKCARRVRNRRTVRLIVDVKVVDCAPHSALEAAVRYFFTDNATDGYGEMVNCGIAARFLKRGERTIGYGADVRHIIDSDPLRTEEGWADRPFAEHPRPFLLRPTERPASNGAYPLGGAL